MSAETKKPYQKAARQTFSLLVRVVNDLCSIELTRELITLITSFIYRLFHCGNYEFVKILRYYLIKFLFLFINNSFLKFSKRLMELIEEKSLLSQKNFLTTLNEQQQQQQRLINYY